MEEFISMGTLVGIVTTLVLVGIAIWAWPLFMRLFGIVVIPEDKVGLVTKKFKLFGDNKSLPDGKIVALKGEAGQQAQTLSPGLKFGFWPWQYNIDLVDMFVVPQGQIGIIMARDGTEIASGHILGKRVECDGFQNAVAFLENGGQKGRQAAIITSGTYRINTYLFEIKTVAMTQIEDNTVGIVTTKDGEPLGSGEIAGRSITGHRNFQDFDTFLANNGQRGLQPDVILAGSYNLNPWAVELEIKPMVEIPIGHVGVVMSYIGAEGKDLSGSDFKHGNIVSKGEKGVWAEPLGPGKYPINIYCYKIELVPTTNLVLNWATGRNESHQLDKNLSTITVRSKDGFKFNLDVSQIIHVPMNDAPKVIARFGSMTNLVSQVLEPTIGNYFRNSAQDSDVISFLSTRQQRQEAAKVAINGVLEAYNVHGVDTLIGDINPPAELMGTLTDRKIAQEQEKTFETQQSAQIKRSELEKQTALANMQTQVVQAERGVEIADKIAQATVKKAEGDGKAIKVIADAESEKLSKMAVGQAKQVELMATAEAQKISQIGKAEADKILATGKATAESYKLAVEAMGQGNFTQIKVMEQLAGSDIKFTPDVLVNSGAGDGVNGGISGLLGMELLRQNLNRDKVEVVPQGAVTGKKG